MYTFISGAYSGLHERMLLEDLLAYYNKLERPVANESDAVVLTFGLTLQQIIDVVSYEPIFTTCVSIKVSTFIDQFTNWK